MLLTIAAFVFVLGVLIFVHELGHFLMARRIGVRVMTFSLGFGPKLFGFSRGGTEYRVSAVPLGGYVKMAGETPDDPRTGQPDEFLSKTKWQRFQVLIMGPVMNILLAIVLMWVVLMQGDRESVLPPAAGEGGRDCRGVAGRARRRSARGRHRHRRRAQGRHLGAVLDGHRHEGQAGGGDRGRPRRSDRAADRDAGRADEVRDRRHRRLPGRASVDRAGRGRRGGRDGAG